MTNHRLAPGAVDSIGARKCGGAVASSAELGLSAVVSTDNESGAHLKQARSLPCSSSTHGCMLNGRTRMNYQLQKVAWRDCHTCQLAAKATRPWQYLVMYDSTAKSAPKCGWSRTCGGTMVIHDSLSTAGGVRRQRHIVMYESIHTARSK